MTGVQTCALPISPTVQSDLFALGLVLCQLVRGDLRKPMAPGWEQGIDDELLVEDITAATHGDPARRLSSVTELTQRLRSLDSRRLERAELRAASERALATQRALERARIRRPWIVTALVVMVIGTAVSYNLYRQERGSRLQAEREATRAETINRFLSEDLLGAADPAGPGGTYNPTIREVLDRTAASLDTRFAADARTKASIELALGTAYYGLSDYASSEKYRRDAVRLLTASPGADDAATLDAEYDLAMVLGQTSRLDEAGSLLNQTDRRARARLSQDSPLAFKAHWTHANYYRFRMSAAQALSEYIAAERVRAAVDPGDDRTLARLRSGLSWCYVRMGRVQKADEVLREVLSSSYTPARLGPVLWASLRVNDATALNTLGRFADAEKALKDALQELRQTSGNDNVFVANAENELGEVYSRNGHWAEAADCYKDAYRIYALRLGEEARNTFITRTNLGIVEYKTGHAAAAVQALEPIRAHFMNESGDSGPLAQVVAFYLAGAQRDLGNYAEASSLVAHLDAAQLSAAEPRDDWGAQLEALRRSILQGLRPGPPGTPIARHAK